MPRCPSCYRRLGIDRRCPAHPNLAVDTPIPTTPEPLELPGYRSSKHIGSGGFAVVWSALRERDGEDVAIKVSHAATVKAARRFEREAQALERVGAPHVPELFECGRLSDGRAYLVMELLRGSSLAAWLSGQPRPLEPVRAFELLDAVLAGVHAVHEAGLVHGDLTPENIVITTGSPIQARLLDFGITRTDPVPSARIWREREETREEIIGSAEYMAPEQLLGAVTPAADIYAAGVLLYELLTLRVPFVGDVASIRHGHRTLRPPRPGLFADVPAPMEALCLACLAKEPGKRPADVRELQARLRDAAQRSASAAPASAGKTSRRPSSILADAHQPVVLLAVEVDAGARAVIGTVERHKGVIARQIGRRYVCGFSALDDAEPIRSALEAARELVQRYAARVVLHIAQLKVRRRRRGHTPQFFGPALQDVRRWKPEREWRGILLTKNVAEALPDDATQRSVEHPDFFELTAIEERMHTEPTLLRLPVQVSLFGRARELETARASFRTVLDHQSPGLLTVYAEDGMGKSRFGHELVSLARELAPSALILWARATRQILGRTEETLRTLVELIAEHDLTTLPADWQMHAPEGARLLGDGLRSSERPVVLILDDAHYADSASLDALEYATLDGERVSLWVVVLGRTRLRSRRPRWGERANRHTVIELGPLSEEAAMELAAALLAPAEYPPAAALQKLARWAAGSPHALEELVRTLKREGMVRKRSHTDSWYVATAALEHLPASPASQWLAARRLDALPVELGACLRLCAVLGVEFSSDELEWVQNAADRDGGASSSIDADVGLAELARMRFLDPNSDTWSFRQAAFQDAVYNLLSSRDRARIHGYALEFWRTQAGDQAGLADDRVLAAVARHAGASGALGEAADAYLELGDRARTRHRDVSADQHYTQALLAIASGDHERRLRALSGRGRVRYRIQRGREALQDLERAREHARALADDHALADLLLEEAIALDWDWQFKLSSARVDAARPLVERSASEPLRAKYLCGVGRVHAREERLPEAIDALEQAQHLAEACGADEVRIIALTMLAGVLGWLERPDEAMARFDELIALCEKTGDRFHLCAAYSNRGAVWDSPARAARDLAQAIQLARELGQPVLERSAAHNLADLLYRQGQHDEALALARRSYDLQRFFPEPTHVDALLGARILAALEDFAGVAEMIEQARDLAESLPLTHSENIILGMLQRLLDEQAGAPHDREAWHRLTDEARVQLPEEEFLDVLYVRACAARRAHEARDLEEIMAEVNRLVPAHPLWRALFEQF